MSRTNTLLQEWNAAATTWARPPAIEVVRAYCSDTIPAEAIIVEAVIRGEPYSTVVRGDLLATAEERDARIRSVQDTLTREATSWH